MNGIMMKSFYEVSEVNFSLLSTFHPEIQVKGAFLCSLGVYTELFPVRQYFDG